MIYTRDINNLFMSPIYTKCKKILSCKPFNKKRICFYYIIWKSEYLFMMCICYLLNIQFWQWSDEMGRFLQWINLQQILYVSNKIIFFFSTWNKINTYIEIIGISYIWILTVKKNLFFCRKFNSNVSRICIPTIHFKIKIYIIMKWNITVIEY